MADRPVAPVTASGSKKSTGGKKTLSRCEIAPSTNGGFTVEQRYKTERKSSSGPGCCYDYVDPETYTFESKDSLIAHLQKTL
jgi:hypothetical protein